MFDHIINWKLREGSHPFPGPDGGTCINEAAIVAAGFEYRKVGSYEDFPPCFCPVLGQFAIVVNDNLPDRDRQTLMPLVTRLAGSKASEEWIERARAEFIFREVERDIIEPFVRHADRSLGGRDKIEEACKAVHEHAVRGRFADAMNAVGHAAAIVQQALGYRSIQWMAMQELTAIDFDLAIGDTCEVRTESLGGDQIWQLAARCLMRAFLIGNQAPAADTAQVVARMEEAKAKALEAA